MLFKSALTFMVSALLCSGIAHAQTPVEFAKKVYSDALNDDLMAVDIVKLHGSPDLRRLIDRRDRIAQAHQGEMCEWVYNPLIPGNDVDTRLKQMKFTQLSNGRVRAQGKNLGYPFKVDLAVQCSGDTCKIADLYNPDSYM